MFYGVNPYFRNMKRNISPSKIIYFILLYLGFQYNAAAQQDILYFDIDWKETDRFPGAVYASGMAAIFCSATEEYKRTARRR